VDVYLLARKLAHLLVQKKDTTKAKAELAAANRVYQELEVALKDFAVAV
jgi:hypothetical protein